MSPREVTTPRDVIPVLLGERVTGRTVCRRTHRVVPAPVVRVWCGYCSMYHVHVPERVDGHHQGRCVQPASPGYRIHVANGQEATW